MKKVVQIAIVVALSLLSAAVFAQNLHQTVRGTILDEDSKMPLVGANIKIILGSTPDANVPIQVLSAPSSMGAATDIEGRFRIENVPIGRITLVLNYLGYEQVLLPNIVVTSGKEVVLNLTMQESAMTIHEVVVTVDKNKGEALHDMAAISARSVSPEQTNRYAGGFNDPSRILSNFAGITSVGDGGNDIIVRGNAPKYVQWRLEGEQITNPNHFADQSAVGGAISTLNNNILAASDFYTGAFPAEFGDALSGVYDVRLRTGNNEKFESVFGFGLIGTDLTLEGPFKKGYGGSYLVNYRYSTAAVLNQLGLLPITGVPKFQDAAFKIVLPTQKAGIFSLYGLGGLSNISIDDVTPAIWQTPGDRGQLSEISEDFEKTAHLANLGLVHTLSLGSNSFLKTNLAYSNEGIEDRVFEDGVIRFFDDEGVFLRDSVISRTLNFNGDLQKATYRGSMTYNHKFNARNKIQVGTKYTLFDYQFEQSQFQNTENDRFTLIDFDEQIGTLRNFISWKYRPNDRLNIVTGLHNMNVLFNQKSTWEPRLALNWRWGRQISLNAGYGLHSNMEAVHHYFAKIKQPNGSITEPNRDLDLLKAHHFVLGLERRFGKNLLAKIEAYYQHLYDIPVENNDTSYFSTLNEGLEFRYLDLVNAGTGKNYGIELSLERFFNKNYYFLVNASLYQSKYQSLEGVERNTQYNGNYLVNVLAGKEWPRLGKRNNQTLGVNLKAFLAGGKKIVPLLRDAQGNLAVDPTTNRFYDYSKAYESSLDDSYQVIASLSYKWDKRRATHEFFLNLDNLTNNKARLSEFYDDSEPGKIGYVRQFGLFPNLMYRVYF